MNQRQQDRERPPPPKPWTEEEIRKLIEPAKRPFLQVAKRDGLPLIWTREADYAVQLILKDPRFRQCGEHTIVNSVKNLVFVGLSLNPTRQHAIILPRYIRWPEPARYEAGVMVMYRGLMHLATEAGAHGLKSEVVYKTDQFTHGSSSTRGDWYEYQVDPHGERKPDDFMGAFCRAKMPAGDLNFEWVPKNEIYKARDQSESYLDRQGEVSKYSPWSKWFDEMAKKVALKRASKRWEEMMGDSERWERFLRAIQIDNETEGVIKPRATDIEGEVQPQIETPEVLLLTHEQVKSIRTQMPTPTFGKRICEAYGVSKLEEIPAAKYAEIGQRLETARAEAEKKRAEKGKANG